MSPEPRSANAKNLDKFSLGRQTVTGVETTGSNQLKDASDDLLADNARVIRVHRSDS